MSISPRVLVVEDFLSEEECSDIIETAKGKMEPRFAVSQCCFGRSVTRVPFAPSTVSAEGHEAKSITQSSRTSSTAWLNPSHYALGAQLRQRVSELVPAVSL